MHYEINVSKNGKHYFATHPRSLTYSDDAIQALKDFRARFPESEGFLCICTEYSSLGRNIESDQQSVSM